MEDAPDGGARASGRNIGERAHIPADRIYVHGYPLRLRGVIDDIDPDADQPVIAERAGAHLAVAHRADDPPLGEFGGIFALEARHRIGPLADGKTEQRCRPAA